MRRVGLRVFVVYSDRCGAEIGSRACRALRERLGEGFQMNQGVWNVELFRSPKLRVLAAKEAMEADIVFMAMGEGAPLEPDVEAWLSLWQRRGRAGGAALVALLRRDSVEAPHVVAGRLHAFAEEAEMDFFCHSEVTVEVGKGAVETECAVATA